VAYANNFDLNKATIVIAGPFVATWVIALSVWRFDTSRRSGRRDSAL
jgi:hypothetical protein